MPRIRTDNYDTVASWNGSQDLFIVEQPDGTKVATPAMVKQFIEAGDFEAAGEIKDGHGNILKDMAKSVDVDAEIGDLSQTGLTGDSVAEQLGDAKEKIADLNTVVDTTKIKTVKLNKNQSATISANVRDYWAMMAVCYIPGEGGRLLGFVYTNGTGEVKNLWNGNTFSSNYVDFTFSSTGLTVTAKNYNGYVFSFIVTPPAVPY